jgi:predicted RNA-binding protein with RPS1 domain
MKSVTVWCLSHRRALVERKMNGLQVGEVVLGAVRGLKPYGAFIDIGGVSGLLHISEISHDHIDTPHSVFNVNDEIKVMIIDLDAERGRISLSTKQLEPEPGDMVKNPDLVYDKAEEMAAKYREQMRKQAAEKEAAESMNGTCFYRWVEGWKSPDSRYLSFLLQLITRLSVKLPKPLPSQGLGRYCYNWVVARFGLASCHPIAHLGWRSFCGITVLRSSWMSGEGQNQTMSPNQTRSCFGRCAIAYRFPPIRPLW